MINLDNLNISSSDNTIFSNSKSVDIQVGGKTYTIQEKVTEGEKIVWALVYCGVTCYLVPAWTPMIVISSILLGSLYGIGCVYEEAKKRHW